MPPRNTAVRAFALALLLVLPHARPARADKDWPALPPEHMALTAPKVEKDADAEVW